jgi:hypothetical protein
MNHAVKSILGAERVERIRESIVGIGVVERLGAEKLEKRGGAIKRCAVVNVLVRLNNPDKLLTRVVEVELDLVGRRTYRLITSELKLLDEVFVGVLGHATSLVGVKEDVVNVERSSDKRLRVSRGGLTTGATGASNVIGCPEALINRAEVNVNLDFVVLKSDEGKSKTRVSAVPELKRNVKSGLRKSLAGSTDLGGSMQHRVQQHQRR